MTKEKLEKKLPKSRNRSTWKQKLKQCGYVGAISGALLLTSCGSKDIVDTSENFKDAENELKNAQENLEEKQEDLKDAEKRLQDATIDFEAAKKQIKEEASKL